MGELILREFRVSDKKELVNLLRIGLTKDFSIKRWDWLYHSQGIEGSHIVVAEFEGRVVGSVGAIKKKFVRNDEEFVGARHLDPVVDTSMRGKGVFSKMLKVLNEMNNDVDFIYTFPNKISFPGFAKSGYTPIGPISNGYCHLAFKGVPFKDKLKYLKTGAKSFFNKKTSVTMGSLHELRDCKWKKPLNKYSLKKDYKYLNWRYGESPIKKYDILICRKGNDDILNACVVARVGNFIVIVDLLEYKSSIDIKEYIIAVQQIYGPFIVSLWKNNIDGNLDSFFWTRGKGGSFMVRDVNNKMPDYFFQNQNWFISHGEIESN